MEKLNVEDYKITSSDERLISDFLEVKLMMGKKPGAKVCHVVLGQDCINRDAYASNLANSDASLIPISDDIIRSYHPKYKEAIKKHPYDYRGILDPYTTTVRRKLINKATEHSLGMVIQFDGQDELFIGTMISALKAGGYDINLHFVVANAIEAEVDILARFISEYMKEGNEVISPAINVGTQYGDVACVFETMDLSSFSKALLIDGKANTYDVTAHKDDNLRILEFSNQLFDYLDIASVQKRYKTLGGIYNQMRGYLTPDSLEQLDNLVKRIDLQISLYLDVDPSRK